MKTITMNEKLNELVDGLKSKLQGNLLSVVLYGSAARNDSHGAASDVNVLVVLKELSLTQLIDAEKIIRKAREAHSIELLFWSEQELLTSWDVFPVELDGILKHHKVLYGSDLFAGASVDRKYLRHQVEFELRSKLFKMRAEWLDVRKSKSELARFLARAARSFQHLFPFAEELTGGKIPESCADVFRACGQLKMNGTKLSQAELEGLYRQMHDAAGQMVAVINHA